MNPLPRLLLRSLLLLVPFVILALPINHFFGAAYGVSLVAIATAWQLVNQLKNFSRLFQWAAKPSNDNTLEGSGAWDEVFGQLYRHNRKLNERIAKRDEEIQRFESAGHALTDGVIMLNDAYQIEWCNAMAENQLGLMLRSDRAQPIVNLVRRPEFVQYLQTNDFSKPLVMRSDRGDRVLSIHIIHFATDRRLMQVRDVTQADLLDQMRRDFVANVSHELRTPLTVLAGFVETLQEYEVEPEERQRYLGMMGEQSQRMLAIVQDLLTLSSIESAPPPDNTPVDMANLMNKLQRDAEALSQGRHIIEVVADLHQDICGAETELISAFSNLVANAIRYTPEGGKVKIRWEACATGGELSVEDSGIGIEAKHIPRLTERFYRVDRGRSRDAGGTGLGLAIVKHSLQRHDAQLAITSEIGKGSCFTAVFPQQRMCHEH